MAGSLWKAGGPGGQNCDASDLGADEKVLRLLRIGRSFDIPNTDRIGALSKKLLQKYWAVWGYGLIKEMAPTEDSRFYAVATSSLDDAFQGKSAKLPKGKIDASIPIVIDAGT